MSALKECKSWYKGNFSHGEMREEDKHVKQVTET